MMQFFVVPVVVATIVLGIYKLFELFVCRRERMMLIERLQDVNPQVLSNFSYGMNELLVLRPEVGLSADGHRAGDDHCLLPVPLGHSGV